MCDEWNGERVREITKREKEEREGEGRWVETRSFSFHLQFRTYIDGIRTAR